MCPVCISPSTGSGHRFALLSFTGKRIMLIRDIALGRFAGLLDTQVLLFIPIFNADGNDKLGHNRRDLGPELAGVRFNGQNLDLNRDYLKLESPEVQALVDVFNAWDPVLTVDMHTTNGSYHRSR